MWPYQRQFQESLQGIADALCHALSRNLRASVFLVGVLREEDGAPSGRVQLEPKECGFSPQQFEDAVRRVEDTRHDAADTHASSSPSLSRNLHEQRRHTRFLRSAILGVVKSGSRSGAHTACSCSAAMPVDQHNVAIVLRWIYSGDNPPPQLPPVRLADDAVAPVSLLDAAVREFLDDCVQSLNSLRPELVARYHGRSVEELLRAAGARLMEVPVWQASRHEEHGGMFTACNVISSLPYEGAESVGSMLVAHRGHPNVREVISLHTPIPLANHRAVRKLLEISAGGDSLLCEGAHIYGFGWMEGSYERNRGDLFRVNFNRFYTWELLHDGQRLMRVAFGDPRLPQPRIDARMFRGDVKRIFPHIARDAIEALLSLAGAACGQNHGTILIISSQAESEAQRLESQCIRIDPIRLNAVLIKSITAIDGAVLLDPQGVCYAVGAILDGLASPAGDPSRGARFNSSVRYVAGKEECLAVIISEDGSVEWVPAPTPDLSRAELDRVSRELRELLSREEIDGERCRRVLGWVKSRELYLPPDICAKAAELARRQRRRESELEV